MFKIGFLPIFRALSFHQSNTLDFDRDDDFRVTSFLLLWLILLLPNLPAFWQIHNLLFVLIFHDTFKRGGVFLSSLRIEKKVH